MNKGFAYEFLYSDLRLLPPSAVIVGARPVRAGKPLGPDDCGRRRGHMMR